MSTVWYNINLPELSTDLLKDEFTLTGPYVDCKSDDPLEGVEAADFLLLNTGFPARVPATYERLGRVKAIVRLGIGYDNVDLDLATANRVCVVNTPDAPSEATAEYAMLLILNLARPLMISNQRMRAGEWPKTPQQIGMELAGKTLGLVGLGRIGSRVAEMARGFLMRVMVFDPYVDRGKALALGAEQVDDINEIYAAADFVSLHLPLLPENRGMINRETIGRMKKNAFLVNVSRGGLVVEKDLQEALERGRLAGAGLDVWDPEPPAPDNPLIAMPNVIATPHIASSCWEMLRKTTQASKDAILAYLRDEQPVALLNPEVWDNRKR